MRSKVLTPHAATPARGDPALGEAAFVAPLTLWGGGFIMTLMLVQVGGAIGTIAVALQIAMALLLFLAAPGASLRVAIKWWPLLILPLLAILSCLWSSAGAASLRYGVQFLLTAFIGIFLASRLRPEALLQVVFWSGFVFLILCVLSGRQGSSMQGPVLIGLAGSKNQIGNTAQLVLIAAACVALMRQALPVSRVGALVAAPLAFVILYQSNAATPLVLTILGIALLVALLLLGGAPKSGRLTALLTAALVSAPLFLLWPEISAWAEDFMINTLGKDPTLTGRTLLWAKADELIALRPWGGHGYQALWVGESAEAVGLRAWTGMQDGRTFNFHNTFLQIGTDLGWVGMIAFGILLAATTVGWVRRFLLGLDLGSAFFVVVFVMLVARMGTEAFLGAFTAATAYFFMATRLAFSPHEDEPGFDAARGA